MKKYRIVWCILGFILLSASFSFGGVARLSEISGQVKYLKGDKMAWEAASIDMELNNGDKVKTEVESHAKIIFYSGHSAFLDENSEMKINQTDDNKTSLDLFKGKLRSKVKSLSKGQNYKVETPQAVCAVRGTDFDVSIINNITEVKVYEGIVEAKEIITGEKVQILAGQESQIIENQKPSEPVDIEDFQGEKKEETDKETTEEKSSFKEEARREMFEEISRDAVLAKASEEIKRAEYENGKALIDAHGKRVRLEEYIVRPETNEFKYVVLNTREERFDFGKILFKFNKDLPADLTLVTKNMFYTETEPDYVLTDMVSVMSNTADSVNEEAHDGQMIPDDLNTPSYWTHFFGRYNFSIKGKDKDRVELWSYNDSNSDGIIQSSEYVYPLGEPIAETGWPEGQETLCYLERNIYDNAGTNLILEAKDYVIDDNGNIQKISDFESMTSAEVKDYMYKLNFERTYESSEFSDSIDIVYSSKLLIDSGILSMPSPAESN
jgi:hypothetical protein